MAIQLGYVIPAFDYAVPVKDLFPTVMAQAHRAEAAGFDTVAVIDHFSQIPHWGPPNASILESYTTLAALAAATSTVQLTALVTGNTYRNPALLAKMVTSLDVISGGRAQLGIGAGWYELEHRQLGYDFGTTGERFERLAEALQIIEQMLRTGRSSFTGTWYDTDNAINEPRLRDNLPILVGGGGEKKTFALAARHASHVDIMAVPAELPRKLEALHQRCREQHRDPSTLTTSVFGTVFIAADRTTAHRHHQDYMHARGFDTLSDDHKAMITSTHFVGTPDDVAEQVRTRVLAAGINGFTAAAPVNGHQPDTIELIAQALRPLIPTH
ncbi:TIGR03560 family F420-dependent LLM class oxidoreductase [Nocardia sp. GCM10030253]|uniref:TIGR03560 family F420-dependent LLM class oxidoreductase n=1 Tax=Nocardia sp. GCM10030253 TaxID=3273404 RepID=UPI0036303221